MKDQQQGLMEEEIITEELGQREESQQTPDAKKISKFQIKNLLTTTQKIALRFKKPKIATLVLLFIFLIAIYSALALLSKRNQQEIPSVPTVELTSPSPQASIDSKLTEITKKVENYNKKLENLDSYSSKLTPPIVDLEIEFK